MDPPHSGFNAVQDVDPEQPDEEDEEATSEIGERAEAAPECERTVHLSSSRCNALQRPTYQGFRSVSSLDQAFHSSWLWAGG